MSAGFLAGVALATTVGTAITFSIASVFNLGDPGDSGSSGSPDSVTTAGSGHGVTRRG